MNLLGIGGIVWDSELGSESVGATEFETGQNRCDRLEKGF